MHIYLVIYDQIFRLFCPIFATALLIITAPTKPLTIFIPLAYYQSNRYNIINKTISRFPNVSKSAQAFNNIYTISHSNELITAVSLHKGLIVTAQWMKGKTSKFIFDRG